MFVARRIAAVFGSHVCSTVIATLLMLGSSFFCVHTAVSEDVIWKPFRNGTIPQPVNDTPIAASDLVLLALTNDVDQTRLPDETTSIDFWARSALTASLRGVYELRAELAGRLRCEVVKLGLPQTVTGGRIANRPERLALTVFDHEFRLLAFSIGIPSASQLQTLIEDAEETRVILDASRDAPHRSTELIAARSMKRINHFYAERLQFALAKLMPINDQLKPMIAADRGDEDASKDSDELETDNQIEPLSNQPTEFASEVQLAPEDATESEWENPLQDREWENGLQELEMPDFDPPKATRAAEAQIASRLRLIEIAITQLYRMDANSRFGSENELSRAALLTVEQHTEARAHWCDCVEPILAGTDIRLLWRPLLEQTWQSPLVRHETVATELRAWLEQVRPSANVALILEDFPITVASEPSPVEPSKARSRINWADLQTGIAALPNRKVSVSQLAALIEANDLRPIDLHAPTAATYVILQRKSNRPLLLRQGDSLVKQVTQVRRLGKQNQSVKIPPGESP